MYPSKKILALKADWTLQIFQCRDQAEGQVSCKRGCRVLEILDRHPTLARAQIINYRVTSDEKWLVLIAIDSYIKAEDPSNFAAVIEIWSRAGKHDDLVRFLQMARKHLCEPQIDVELAYAGEYL